MKILVDSISSIPSLLSELNFRIIKTMRGMNKRLRINFGFMGTIAS